MIGFQLCQILSGRDARPDQDKENNGDECRYGYRYLFYHDRSTAVSGLPKYIPRRRFWRICFIIFSYCSNKALDLKKDCNIN